MQTQLLNNLMICWQYHLRHRIQSVE